MKKDVKRPPIYVDPGPVVPPPETAFDDYKQLLADLAYATHIIDDFDWSKHGDGKQLARKIAALKAVRNKGVPVTEINPT